MADGIGIALIHAGFAPVWNALVIFPLFNYRNEMNCSWGAVNLLTGFYAQFTFPAVLKYAPAILLLSRDPVEIGWLEMELAELERLVDEGDTLEVSSLLSRMVIAPKRLPVRADATEHAAARVE